MLSAGEFCNRDVVFATPEERIVDVARRMRDYHVGTVVIVEERAEGRAPLGILTDRDLVVDLLAVDPGRVEQATVRELMRGRLVVAREEEALEDALQRMRSEGIRRLPVIDQAGILQGIIAFDDLVQYLVEELAKLVALLQREQAGERACRPARPQPPAAHA
jgi:CBS domain-containing protein